MTPFPGTASLPSWAKGFGITSEALGSVDLSFHTFRHSNRPVKGRALDIRGKCPLELAGYDISHIPIARILRGQLLGWPSEALKELVPNA